MGDGGNSKIDLRLRCCLHWVRQEGRKLMMEVVGKKHLPFSLLALDGNLRGFNIFVPEFCFCKLFAEPGKKTKTLSAFVARGQKLIKVHYFHHLPEPFIGREDWG